MKFDKLVETTWETFFLKDHTQNVVEELLQTLF